MKLKFNYNVPDKNTGEVYEKGKVYEFTEERAKEILAVINRDTGVPFAVEVKENAQKNEKKVQNASKKTKNAQSKGKKEETTEEETKENTDIEKDAE